MDMEYKYTIAYECCYKLSLGIVLLVWNLKCSTYVYILSRIQGVRD
jgi:hypothetical protein